MAKLKRLIVKEDTLVKIIPPISKEDIENRDKDYPTLSPVAFAKKYRNTLFKPVTISINDTIHNIQLNYCDNPFCKSLGEPQVRFNSVKNKPFRYKLAGSDESKKIICNPNASDNLDGISLGCYTTPYSNWAIAEEIKRLIHIDKVIDWLPKYNFHREECAYKDTTPFSNLNSFRKRGKSSSKSIKWQCKSCGKITNVLPLREENFGYHQKRNDIIPLFAKLLLNRTPVKRSCEILQVTPTTYYNKLEWLYKKCLEFLDSHERKAFKNHTFERIWLNTDKMIYNLNNVRRRGKGGERYDDIEELQFPTHILVSGDSHSKYIFRADVAYDWNIAQEEITADTKLLKEDHLHNFSRKNARYRFPFCPQVPTKNDKQSYEEYLEEYRKFNIRNSYIDGLHVVSSYTAFAHYWLIKNMIKTNKWRFVSDEDSSLMTPLFRVFAPEIKEGKALHFLCEIEKGKTKKEAYNEYVEARESLKEWKNTKGLYNMSDTKIGIMKLIEKLNCHKFHNLIESEGHSYPVWANRPLKHPLPSIDEGTRIINCTTNVSNYDIEHLARLLMNVDNHAVNSFMQQIHRRLSILERPLTTARGEGKSYVYANFNPKYAQYALTILRTYYNFCMSYKTLNKQILTPAQQLGITNKKFELRDIIYYK
ncbi:MAG: hypothetical protein K0R09_808 [Clostridiales bacterium]|nr:hypothetical protein [Clostridiales bacterium]